jgi:hypothetical protein
MVVKRPSANASGDSSGKCHTALDPGPHQGHVGRRFVTSHHPSTGAPDLGTLETIARYRGDLTTAEMLAIGVHARVLVPGRVAGGDRIVIGQ